MAGVIGAAITLSVAALILGTSAAATDCSTLPGALTGPARTVTVNQSTTVNVASTCYRNVTTYVTTYTPTTQTTTTWSVERLQCLTNGGNTAACDSQRAAARATLDAAGYVNLKTSLACAPATFVAAAGYYNSTLGANSTAAAPAYEGTSVARSTPNATSLEVNGYCFGRMWSPTGSAVYITSWNVANTTTTTIQVPTLTPVITNQSYSCQVPRTTYALVNVTIGGASGGGTGASPGTWSATCYESQEQARAGFGLLALVVIVAAAIVVIGATRFLAGARDA